MVMNAQEEMLLRTQPCFLCAWGAEESGGESEEVLGGLRLRLLKPTRLYQALTYLNQSRHT